MLPETLVTLISTLEKSGCCAAASVQKKNGARTAKIVEVRMEWFINGLRCERGSLALVGTADEDSGQGYARYGLHHRKRGCVRAYSARSGERKMPPSHVRLYLCCGEKPKKRDVSLVT